MTVKELIQILGPCDPNSEIKSIKFFKDSNKQEAMDLVYKDPVKHSKHKAMNKK